MDGTQILTLGLGLEAPWILKDQHLDTSVSPHRLDLYVEAERPLPGVWRLKSLRWVLLSSLRDENLAVMPPGTMCRPECGCRYLGDQGEVH